MGRGRIKGITIEIGGNTSKLTESLRNVDSSLSKTQSSLRDVNRLLKLDPKNTELVAQKQRMLRKAIDETKDRLNVLKEADKQAKEQLASGKMGQDQYDALQREIAETEGKLKSLEEQAKKMPTAMGTKMQEAGKSISQVGTNIENAGEKIGGFGKKLLPISTAAGAVSVASGKMAIDFEDNISSINTLLDDDKHLSGYKQKIVDMSNKTGIALETMGDGMYQAISSLGDGGKETEKIFETMGISAKAGGAEVADSVSLISAGMKGYNSVNDETAKKISDLAFQTAKLGVTTFPEMAKNMQPLFPLSSSLNLSYEELFGTMATLTGVTGNTSEVSTQLKAVFSNLMKPTEAMGKLMNKYGYESGAAMIQSEGLQGVLNILKEETGGQADKMAALFSSTEAVTAITALTGAQYDTFGEKLLAMNDCVGATQTAYDKLNTNGDVVRRTINELSNTATEFGGTLLEMLAPVIETISEKVHMLSEWFSKLSPQQQELVSKFAMMTIAIGPAITIFGNLTAKIGTVVSIGGKLSTFLGGLPAIAGAAGGGLALFSGPLLPIIGIIGGVVGAGVLLYKNWDTIKEKASQLGQFLNERWNSIKASGTEAWNGLKTSISEKWEGIKNKSRESVARIKESTTSGWNNLKSNTVEKWDGIKNAITEKIDGARDRVKSGIDKIKSFFNFSWSLPHLKMPHFSISGKFSLKPPSVPHFGVEWYNKAMDNAYILRGASIFGSMGGNLLGAGESGSEMVVGTQHMMNMIQEATAINDKAIVSALKMEGNRIVNILEHYFPQCSNTQVVLDNGVLVGELAPTMDVKLGEIIEMKERGI